MMNLIQSGGEVGFWGSWDKMRFNINRLSPFIVTPQPIARVINLDVCRTPIKLNNQFFEVMEGGIGYQERDNALCRSYPCSPQAGYDRGTQPFTSIITPGSVIRFFPTNAADVGKRIFLTGTDTNGLPVTSLDNGVVVPGLFTTLDLPYVDTALAWNTVDSVVKDLTIGMVAAYQVNTDSTLTLLAQYQPNEQNPSYRKYFVGGLPNNCCGTGAVAQTQIEAMCKREFVPMTCLMDELILGNLEALKHEMMALRFEGMDSSEADGKSMRHHKRATQILQNELDHYMGREGIAVVFNPMGSRCADRQLTALGNLT